MSVLWSTFRSLQLKHTANCQLKGSTVSPCFYALVKWHYLSESSKKSNLCFSSVSLSQVSSDWLSMIKKKEV